MRPTLAWVLGKGGLLGSHLARTLMVRRSPIRCWECHVPKFWWHDAAQLHMQLAQAVTAFAQTVAADYRQWLVLWTAGAGVIGSSAPALHAETETWQLFLTLLGQHRSLFEEPFQGLVFLASSAGGVYGNCPDQPLTELSPCMPISEYGRNKVHQENILQAWANVHPGVNYLIGRISTLYGPGQNLDKPQGLIAHMSRCVIYHRPIHVYVPLDTIRDYVYVEDCSAQIVGSVGWQMQEAARAPRRRGLTKIFASEQATALAQVIGVFSRIAKRQPKVVCALNRLSNQQPKQLQFRSLAGGDGAIATPTELHIGIARLHEYQLGLYRQGRLAAPCAT